MPSDKFWSMPKKRQEELIEAAKEEFAIFNYEDASINRIIRNIHMPRGSFYLYFTNKQDLYLHILKNYIGEFKREFMKILESNAGDIFDSMIVFFDKIVNNHSKDHNLINQIFVNMNSKQLDIAFPKVMKEEMDGTILSMMDISSYSLEEEEKECLLSILMPLFFHAVAMFLENEEKDIVRVHYLKQLNIIKRGLERKDIC